MKPVCIWYVEISQAIKSFKVICNCKLVKKLYEAYKQLLAHSVITTNREIINRTEYNTTFDGKVVGPLVDQKLYLIYLL